MTEMLFIISALLFALGASLLTYAYLLRRKDRHRRKMHLNS